MSLILPIRHTYTDMHRSFCTLPPPPYLPVFYRLFTWTSIQFLRPPLPVPALAVMPPSTCSPGTSQLPHPPCREPISSVSSPVRPPPFLRPQHHDQSICRPISRFILISSQALFRSISKNKFSRQSFASLNRKLNGGLDGVIGIR